ncbi:ribonuclease HII [Haloferula sargassicola]|uniref:Multifunctional fusion protein n=1 Tax=Haloferula sargassicola TaxID=490096 RepID=A0ABP9UMI4_9BACT
MPDFSLEVACRARGHQVIAGIDEAGRGPLAGPVVAAAVILPETFSCPELDDSKKLSAACRERLFAFLTGHAAIVWSVAFVEHEEIDRLNILRATHRAMALAVAGLARTVDHCLIDGLPVPGFPHGHDGVVKGDGLSLSIAAASVLAKVSRDRCMTELAAEFPQYGFQRHKGYGTREHLEALRLHGPCRIHRRSFQPVAQLALPLEGRDGGKIEPAEVGRRGERIAAAWLRSIGAKVLFRNFRAPGGGEVDIVARQGEVLLFVEVKTRTRDDFGRPLEAVNEEKRRLIRRGANEWLRMLGRRDFPWRYDVIEVVLIEGEKPRVNRVEDVSLRETRRAGRVA